MDLFALGSAEMEIHMNKLLLVDGSNLLFQMFFGMPERIVNKDGKPIQGTLGFVGALLKIMRMTGPTHVGVLFDGEHENVRAQLDTDYKGNRIDYSETPPEETPFSQLPDIYQALSFLKIRYAETTVCETDDWISGYALRYGKEQEIVIASWDSDFFQLLTDHVHILRYRGKKTVICDPAYLREQLGIEPSQYADFKSLTGDTADNIKGAEKVGPKTAAALLAEFGTLEQLLSDAQTIHKPSVRESVLRNAERLRKNYQLIHLAGTEELPFEMEELLYHDSGMTSTDVLKGIGVW